MREVSLRISRLSVAKKLIKLELVSRGGKVSQAKPQAITDAAKELIRQRPDYVEYAMQLFLP